MSAPKPPACLLAVLAVAVLLWVDAGAGRPLGLGAGRSRSPVVSDGLVQAFAALDLASAPERAHPPLTKARDLLSSSDPLGGALGSRSWHPSGRARLAASAGVRRPCLVGMVELRL